MTRTWSRCGEHCVLSKQGVMNYDPYMVACGEHRVSSKQGVMNYTRTCQHHGEIV